MESIRLSSASHPLYPRARALYEESFPLHEQRVPSSQQAVLADEAYHFDLLFEGELFLGLSLYWEAPDFFYVEHFCIDPALRGQRYGRRALDLLGQKGKPVILEIDPPEDGPSLRRKAFYERAGYRANGFAHVHPPYQPGRPGHRLLVLSYPDALSAALYGRFSAYLQQHVMAR